jgi:hypothetical protein
MKNLKEINSDVDLESGTILRIYAVHRGDVMKLIEDRDDQKKKAMDYYDLLLFDANNIKDNTFAMINITSNSSKKGYVYAVFDTEIRYAIRASIIKEYFKGVDDVFILS